MLDSVLDANNYIQVNVNAIHILGLINAIYCSELITIFAKSRKKRKQENGFFILDRNYIDKRTSIKPDDQYLCDKVLSKVSVLEVSESNPDAIKFNLDTYTKIVAEDDCKFLEKVVKKTKPTKVDAKEVSKTKLVDELIKAVECDNVDIYNALIHWVQINGSVDYTKMTIDTVKYFQEFVMKYAGSDVNKALRIIEIATAQKWINPMYAIESYEKEVAYLANKEKAKKRTIKVASKDSIDVTKVY